MYVCHTALLVDEYNAYWYVIIIIINYGLSESHLKILSGTVIYLYPLRNILRATYGLSSQTNHVRRTVIFFPRSFEGISGSLSQYKQVYLPFVARNSN